MQQCLQQQCLQGRGQSRGTLQQPFQGLLAPLVRQQSLRQPACCQQHWQQQHQHPRLAALQGASQGPRRQHVRVCASPPGAPSALEAAPRKKLAVFVSGGGSNFKAIHAACLKGTINADVVVSLCHNTLLLAPELQTTAHDAGWRGAGLKPCLGLTGHLPAASFLSLVCAPVVAHIRLKLAPVLHTQAHGACVLGYCPGHYRPVNVSPTDKSSLMPGCPAAGGGE